MLHDVLSASQSRRLASCLAAGALFVAAPRTAHAQYWLQDRAATEGRGIRTGNFELHPGVGAELGYDSNVFYLPSSRTTPALRLRVTPSFSISTALAAERVVPATSCFAAVSNFSSGLPMTPAAPATKTRIASPSCCAYGSHLRPLP